MSPTAEQLADEAARMRKVRQIVDIATAFVRQSGMPRAEAQMLVAVVRDQILELFPGSEETFEIVYSHRFKRLIDEFAVERPASGGTAKIFQRRNG